jgi:ribosomal protein S18 acetylase RimI-like enzyme
MALNFRLRPATSADILALAAIELESFPDPSWTAPDFLRYDCIVAEAETSPKQFSLAGFLVSRLNFDGTSQTPPEREILNLAVTARFRRCGVASCLLANELKREAEVFLEVRVSNAAAIHLYKNAGFTEVARRSDYYDNPSESAIVMRMKW